MIRENGFEAFLSAGLFIFGMVLLMWDRVRLELVLVELSLGNIDVRNRERAIDQWTNGGSS